MPDLLLCTAVPPGLQAAHARLLTGAGLRLAPSGFLQPRDLFLDNVRSSADGIFCAGAVSAPKSLGETLNEGTAAADAAVRYAGM